MQITASPVSSDEESQSRWGAPLNRYGAARLPSICEFLRITTSGSYEGTMTSGDLTREEEFEVSCAISVLLAYTERNNGLIRTAQASHNFNVSIDVDFRS